MSSTSDATVDIDQLIQLFEEAAPFNKFLGIKVVELTPGRARLELPFKPEFIGNPEIPALHGGVISTLMDNAGGLALWTQAHPSDRISTVDLRVDFLQPAKPEMLIAEGKVVRQGNRVGVVELRTYQPSDPKDPVTAGMGVYNIRRL